MQLYRSLRAFRLLSLNLALAGIAGSLTMSGCNGERIIGDGDSSCPCEDTDFGTYSASGTLEIDGLLIATQSLRRNLSSSAGSFEASLGRLEGAFRLQPQGDLKTRVEALITAIQLEVEAHAEGGLSVQLGQASCRANLAVLTDAQARCEAQNQCDVEIDPARVEVSCDGTCVGACSGSCAPEASASCRTKVTGTPCSGSCEGVCETSGAMLCQGTCRGNCLGECTAFDSKGNCTGTCDGECSGICEIEGAAMCNGSCTGFCTMQAAEGACASDAELRCDGVCDGTCSGSCEGQATLPSASANCGASENCQTQATAQASADVQCTPPTVDLTYDASAEAAFSARLDAVRAEAPAMLAAFTQMKALVDGRVNGEVVFAPAPVLSVAAALDSVLEMGIDGALFENVPAGRIPCVLPTLLATVTLLSDVTAEAGTALTAQEAFFVALAAGFKI